MLPEFGVHVPKWTPPELPMQVVVPQPSPELAAAIASANAGERSADIAFWALMVALVTLFVTTAAVWVAYKALTTWKNQVKGEHEFNRLIECYQLALDLQSIIHNYRSPFIAKGESTGSERSEIFRQDLTETMRKFYRSSVGMDRFWPKDFAELRKAAGEALQKIALSSNYLYEHAPNIAGDADYHALGLRSPKLNGNQKAEIDSAKAVIDKPIQDLIDWLSNRIEGFTTTRTAK